MSQVQSRLWSKALSTSLPLSPDSAPLSTRNPTYLQGGLSGPLGSSLESRLTPSICL